MDNIKLELVFIPCPTSSHSVSTVEFANRLLGHHSRFSVTILFIESHLLPTHLFSSHQQQQEEKANKTAGSSLQQQDSSSNTSCIRYIALPEVEERLPEQTLKDNSPGEYLAAYMASQKSQFREAIHTFNHHPVRRLAGIVVDVFSTFMTEVANELDIPTYLFFTSNAGFLGHILDAPTLNAKFKDEDGSISTDDFCSISTFANPVPAAVMPAQLLSKYGRKTFSNLANSFAQTKGIIVNTFEELEPYATKSLMNNSSLVNLRIYNVGPVMDLTGQAHGQTNSTQKESIMTWLDDQPDSSVVFLCFGTMGAFSEPQVKEIATGLASSKLRFLWSLRKPTPGGKVANPQEYTENELKEVLLPSSFWSLLEERRGLVCGWAPQVEVLAHRAVGAFVSHCGWNSILESLWFGVPIVTWPLYAEQHSNAFQLVREFGLGVELRLDYRMGEGDVVSGDEVHGAVRCVMDPNSQVRKRVIEISERSRSALMDGGSSFNAMESLIRDMEENIGN